LRFKTSVKNSTTVAALTDFIFYFIQKK